MLCIRVFLGVDDSKLTMYTGGFVMLLTAIRRGRISPSTRTLFKSVGTVRLFDEAFKFRCLYTREWFDF